MLVLYVDLLSLRIQSFNPLDCTGLDNFFNFFTMSNLKIKEKILITINELSES